MLFWIVAAALTLIACLAVLLPYAGGRGATARDAAYDLEVYADQLRSIDGEAARGMLSRSDAEQARAEIARKVLAAKTRLDLQDKEGVTQSRRKTGAAVAAASVLLVPVVGWAAYSMLGRPDLPSAPLAARLSTPPGQAGVAELVAQAERHLAANPQDGRGWDVIAPVYMRTERYADAANAFRNAIRLNGASVERQNGLGEALVINAQGMVTAEAEQVFRETLKLNAREPVARFYLATAKAQQGKRTEAQSDFKVLLDEAPGGTPWHDAVAQALAQARGAPAQTAPSAAPGPSAGDMEAAAGMAPEDRIAMIEQMVARLSEKLAANPDDLDGWQRLIRSYAVLGKQDEAKAAVGRAMAAFASQDDKRAAIETFAAQMGISVKAGG